jgi:hypothetical protein
MQTHEWMEEEKLWLVRYLYQSDLAKLLEDESAPLQHAVFRGHDEEQIRWKLTEWLRLVLHEEAHIKSVELLPPNALIANLVP